MKYYLVQYVAKGHRYRFLYTEETQSEILRTLGRYAANPDLEFDWYDAASLSVVIRHKPDKFLLKDDANIENRKPGRFSF